MWVAAERWPAALAAYPDATRRTVSRRSHASVKQEWTSIEARVAIVRGLIDTSGPISAEQIALLTTLTLSQVNAALEALEGEGIVLRGQFTPSDSDAAEGDVEWCHRRLLARIHRLTLDGLRKQIQPVSVSTLIRFFARHQGVDPSTRRSGASGLFDVVSLLQGVDLAAAAWEPQVLSARIRQYEPGWFDELCLTGELGWGRLSPPKPSGDKPKRSSGLTKVAPLSLWLREDLSWLRAFVAPPEPATLTETATAILGCLRDRGAMFAADLLHELQTFPGPLEDALSELVSRGWITADGFAGLRQLIATRSDSKNGRGRSATKLVRARRTVAGAGRWSILMRPEDPAETSERAEQVEQWAWQLLRRWGIVFRDLLQRESATPPWFELLQVFRRMEARGEIRGGRFVTGVAGEQFALPDAVARLRKLRDDGPARELVVVSGADPLNLVGILTDHSRVPSIAGNRIAYVDGVPLAALQAGETIYFDETSESLREQLEQALRSGRAATTVDGSTPVAEVSTLEVRN